MRNYIFHLNKLIRSGWDKGRPSSRRPDEAFEGPATALRGFVSESTSSVTSANWIRFNKQVKTLLFPARLRRRPCDMIYWYCFPWKEESAGKVVREERQTGFYSRYMDSLWKSIFPSRLSTRSCIWIRWIILQSPRAFVCFTAQLLLINPWITFCQRPSNTRQSNYNNNKKKGEFNFPSQQQPDWAAAAAAATSGKKKERQQWGRGGWRWRCAICSRMETQDFSNTTRQYKCWIEAPVKYAEVQAK